MKRIGISLLSLMVAISITAQTPKPPASTMSAEPAAVKRAATLFSGAAMAAHDQFLASDLLEGRGPGTRGDDLAMQYIAAQFEAAGLQPAGDNGTYYQKVPLVGITTTGDKTTVAFTKNGANVIGPLKFRDEFVGQDQTQETSGTLDSDVVFVGHGVVAPEYR